MANHDYVFEFEGQRFVTDGTMDTTPDYIVLPDMRVVRIIAILKTDPEQIDEVELVRSSPARKA